MNGSLRVKEFPTNEICILEKEVDSNKTLIKELFSIFRDKSNATWLKVKISVL